MGTIESQLIRSSSSSKFAMVTKFLELPLISRRVRSYVEAISEVQLGRIELQLIQPNPTSKCTMEGCEVPRTTRGTLKLSEVELRIIDIAIG